MREIDDTSILERFATEFCRVVEQHVDYIVVSGFVAIASGRVRGTEDIDMIIRKLSPEQFASLHKDLLEKGFACLQEEESREIYSYLKNHISVRYAYKNQPLPEMELKMEKDGLDTYQFETRTKLDLTGLDIWFSSIEMNIAFKEELLKSQKDMEDSKHLRNIYMGEFQEEEVEKIKNMIRENRM